MRSISFVICQHCRGCGVSDRGSSVNLRRICITSFCICQHYRRCGVPDRGSSVNLRWICIVSPWICQYYRRSEASDRVILLNVHKIYNASPQICESYRGFAHVGRSGPQPVRPGQKVDGKIRYSRNPNQRTLRKNASIIRGDRRSFNIY